MKKVRVIRMQRRSDGYKHDVEIEIKQVKVGRTWKDSPASLKKVWDTILTPDWDYVISFDRAKESTK